MFLLTDIGTSFKRFSSFDFYLFWRDNTKPGSQMQKSFLDIGSTMMKSTLIVCIFFFSCSHLTYAYRISLPVSYLIYWNAAAIKLPLLQ